MPDFHLSKSEIFFYGALSQRLDALLKTESTSQRLETFAKSFPASHELWPRAIEPFARLEQLAAEFGIARRLELEPAGDSEELIDSPEYRHALPDDVSWVFADGTAAREGEFDAVSRRLDAADSEGGKAYSEDGELAFMTASAKHPGFFLDIMTGEPQMVPSNIRQRCYKQHAEAMGAFVMEGFSQSAPGYVFRLTWLGGIYRYSVPLQDNRLYASLIKRFADELVPPRLVLWSLGFTDIRHTESMQSRGPVGREATPQLSAWLTGLNQDYGTRPEWRLGHSLAAAQAATRLLEEHLYRHEPDFLEVLQRGESIRRMATRERLDDYTTYLPVTLDELVKSFEASGRRYDEPATEENLVYGMRFLCGMVQCGLGDGVTIGANEGMAEVSAISRGGLAMARRLDKPLKGLAAGISSLEALRAGSRQLVDAANDALKLAYGQLYFRELADEMVYVDPGTRGRLLREPQAIRHQLVEAIRQYERQTLPNCTVTSACGLIEPVVRQLAAEWLPSGRYAGDIADILKNLIGHLSQQRAAVRRDREEAGEISSSEADITLRLYCADLAFALHMLGNSVRHHADKTLKRHDAGVMLHGLCALIARIGG